MKNNIKTKLAALYDKACREIDKRHAEYYQFALHKGKQDGVKNFPPLHGESHEAFTAPIIGRYKALIAWCDAKLQPGLHMELGTAKRSFIQTQNAKKIDVINELLGKIAVAESQLEESFPLLDIGLFVLAIMVSAGIISGEWVNLSRSLQILGGTYFMSHILGMGVTLGIATVAEFSPVWIAGLSTKVARFIASVSVLSGIMLTFIGIGYLRDEMMMRLYHTTDNHIAYFVAINMVLFGALFFISKFFIVPHLDSVRQAFLDTRAKWRIGRMHNKVNKLDGQIKEDEKLLQETLEDHFTAKRNADHAMTRIENCTSLSMSAYVEGNLQTRTDGVPGYFHNGFPKLNNSTK